MKTTILRINNLTLSEYNYGKLLHSSFSLYEGEVVAFVGLDYSGKDLLTNVLSCRIDIDFNKCNIYVNGEKIIKQTELKKQVFCIRDLNYYIRQWSVCEYISISKMKWILSKRSIQAINAHLSTIINGLGLDIDCNATIGSLTELEKREIDIVKAIYDGYKIIIIEDEFNGMSTTEIHTFACLLKRAVQKKIAVIINCHSFEAASILADRYLIFSNGCIIKKCDKAAIPDVNKINNYLLGELMPSTPKSASTLSSNSPNQIINIYSIHNFSINGNRHFNLDFNSREIITYIVSKRSDRRLFFNYVSGKVIQNNFDYRYNNVPFSPEGFFDFTSRHIVSIDCIGMKTQDSIMNTMTVGDNLIIPSLEKISLLDYFINANDIEKALCNETQKNNHLENNANTEFYKTKANTLEIHDRIIISLERWMIYRPNVIVFYEPFINCDNYGVTLVQSYIKRFSMSGAAVIVVKSRPEYMEEITDSIVEI